MSDYFQAMLGFARDANPNVSDQNMRDAVDEVEGMYGVNMEDFNKVQEIEALEAAERLCDDAGTNYYGEARV